MNQDLKSVLSSNKTHTRSPDPTELSNQNGTAKEYVNMAFIEDSTESSKFGETSNMSPSTLAVSQEAEKPSCGFYKCKPKPMQVCANLVCFTISYSLAALLTQTLIVYLTSQITSVEKQFGFSSSQVGIIMSANDIGFLVTVLFISHFAKRAHIPRFLSGSTFLFGLSGLICCLTFFVDHSPRFLQKESFDVSANDTPSTFRKYDMNLLVCNSTAPSGEFGDQTGCTEKSVQKQASRTKFAFALFMIGMLVQGVAKSPRTSLLTAYIDNNVQEKTSTGTYMGIITSMAIFGPSIAFLFGGIFSKIPVDLKDRGLTPKDPRWIGAWWMGFLLFGLSSIMVSVPLSFFPKTLNPNSHENKKEKIMEIKTSLINQIKEMPKSLWRVLNNPVYDLTLLSICILLFSIAGSITFTPKYVEHQFTQPSWKTNVILGIEKVIGASSGTLLGGVFTSKLKLSRQGCLKLKLVIAFLSTFLEAFGFLFGCPRAEISGVTWADEHGFKQAGIEIRNSCQTPCHCPNDFFPVCGSDRINYLSPCMAGCSTFNETLQNFASCQCIQNGGMATPGLCETGCPYLYPYIGTNLVKAFISTFAIVPGYIVLLRSVLDEDKAIAIGLMSFMMSLLGWLPGPIVFGYIFDSACAWWSHTCGVRGECLLYDIKDMRIKVHTVTVILRFVSGLVLIGAFVTAYTQEKRLEQNGQRENKFSKKMTFKEVKTPNSFVPSVNSRRDISRSGSQCSTPTGSIEKDCAASNGSVSEENTLGRCSNPTSTRL